jgi:hypothetical protein
MLVATEAAGFVNQVHAGINCPDGVAYYGTCPLVEATPVYLDQNGTQPHIVNFTLQRQNQIFSGTFD